MRMRVARFWIAAMVAVLCTLVSAQAQEQSEREKNLESMLQEAMDRYQLGQYMKARAALDRLLAEDPENNECWKLREAFGAKILSEMAAWVNQEINLGDTPLEILKRAQRYDQDKLLDPENIRKTVFDAVRSAKLDPKSLVTVARLGQFAVPQLIAQMLESHNESARVNSSYILVQLGNQVVPALSECLKSTDDVLLQDLCRILMDIKPADPRALPALKRVYDNPSAKPAVKMWAGKALQTITGQDPATLKSAADYMYAEANRYYLGGEAVKEEVEDMRATLWVWDAKAGKKGALRNLKVPEFALDDMLTQKFAYEGLELSANKKKFEVLLASSLLMQSSESKTLASIVKLHGIVVPGITVLKKEVEEWEARLDKNNRIAQTVGADILVGVLDKAMLDGKAPVAVAALEALEKTTGKDGWRKIAAWTHDLVGSTPVASGENSEEKAKAKAPKELSHPVLAALSYPDRRVRYAAANCLSRTGFPADHPEYTKLVPTLVEGAREKSAKVVLVISNDPKARDKYAEQLESKGMFVMTAPTGRTGLQLATQYPPKDAIFIDSELEEFSKLSEQLALYELTPGSDLPLVIVTAPTRVNKIVQQFTGTNWKTHIRNKISADDPKLYDQLRSMHRFERDSRHVAILTNENAKERRRIKEALLMEAESRSRPQRQTELLRLMDKQRMRTDIYPARQSLVNVFVDAELAGYDAMRTTQALRRDSRSKLVPIAIMASSGSKSEVESEFQSFVKDKANVRVVDYEASAKDLLSEVNEMESLNPLSKENYQRKESYATAERCAEALANLETANGAVALSEKAEIQLREVLGDESLPVGIRIEVAKALGHLNATKAAKMLAKVFKDTQRDKIRLRAACMESLGMIDTANEFKQIKLDALDESSKTIQKKAAWALAVADGGVDYRKELLLAKRPNAPLSLLSGAPAPTVAIDDEEVKEKVEEAEEAKEAAEEKAEAEEAEEEEKVEEKKEEKKKEVSEDDIW